MFETLADQNVVLAGKAGVIDAVVAAMRAHVGNAGVSQQACGAIFHICIDNGAFGVDCVFVRCVQLTDCC